MLGAERRNQIVARLNDKKSLLVPETAQLFGVTEETIRRDLKYLESKGLLVRTHGGAVLSDDTNWETPVEVREGINMSGKNAIGLKASQMVEDNDTLFLDASTSCLYLARHLKKKKGLTVVTNAERIILELASCEDITLISSGGLLRPKSLSYVGRTAERAISQYRAAKVFLSSKGFSPRHGLTDSNEQEADIRRTMLACSEKVIFLCDHTKFEKVGFVNTARVDQINVLITDKAFPETWGNWLDSLSLKVIRADQE